MDQMDHVGSGEDNSYSLPHNTVETTLSTEMCTESKSASKGRGPLGQMWMATLNNWSEEENLELDQVLKDWAHGLHDEGCTLPPPGGSLRWLCASHVSPSHLCA